MREQTQSNNQILKHFNSFGLPELDKLNMLDRYDDKAFFHVSKLPGLLNALKAEADVLKISGKHSFAYQSIYLDTDARDLYLRHHNQRKHRHKIRYRKYLDQGVSFLEIKNKSLNGFMSKLRLQFNGDQEQAANFIDSNTPYQKDALEESLKVTFFRSTLLNKARTESLTIDQELHFENSDRKSNSYQNLVILELKQKTIDTQSPFRQAIRDAGIRMKPISKYCLGLSILEPELKQNRFIQLQREVEKIETHA